MSLKSRLVFPTPHSTHPIVRAVRFVWTLPTNALGHLAGLVVSGARGRKVGGRAGVGFTYQIRGGIGLDWVGAVTLGNAILHTAGMFDGPRGRLVLAHELAHTRQHDVLGPTYLPLHIVAQLVSATLGLVLREKTRFSPVHDRNPLEQTFIVIAAGATREWVDGTLDTEIDREAFLAEFGL
ncbi:MAG: hypothetical protein ABI175_16780 [Polyangiales bacterium]